ncbi:aldehyde dehydrogenase family protein [Saccharopolyspora taberi]|uniref:Aldehyde dehydrogenase family protein n=1 Tax=Saccharopolyspora taberi TaxID=60895 RepID=A0ABN3V3N5_9PSEU
MTRYASPGQPGSAVSFAQRYDHFIGGEYVKPVKGEYFDNITPVTGERFTEIARGTHEDVERALDAAEAAAPAWGRTSPAERAAILNGIADRMEAELTRLAVAETWDNGKPIREPVIADIPLAIDQFRYFAAAIRTQEGTISQLDDNTAAYHFNEPLGVVAQIVPWNVPLFLTSWKLAPALAAGNAVVLKPAEQTPASIHVWLDLVADLLPPGVLNVVNGFGPEAGKPLASSKRIRKVSFTGGTETGRDILSYTSANIVPTTLELGGKNPNIFFADVAAEKDAFYDKALEGFTMFTLVEGEACQCPSRALIQSSIYDQFLGDAKQRTESVKLGHPLDDETMVGALVSEEQYRKVLSYIEQGKKEGAKTLAGGGAADLGGELSGGFYVTPTLFEGDHSMSIFQQELFGPIVCATSFSDFDDAIRLANSTEYALGAGVWTRDAGTAYRAGRAIQAGTVFTNCYHQYTAHSAIGGYGQSGMGRENHKMALNDYQQTKNLLVSYSPDALGFF